mgnify:CR=1 FL=1
MSFSLGSRAISGARIGAFPDENQDFRILEAVSQDVVVLGMVVPYLDVVGL